MPKVTDTSTGDAKTEAALKTHSQKARRQKVGQSLPDKDRRPITRKKAAGSSEDLRLDTKQAKVIGLLRRSQGASIEEMMKTTGWQAHSVRGVMSGALKKKLGLSITSAKEKRGRIYRIVDSGKQRVV